MPLIQTAELSAITIVISLLLEHTKAEIFTDSESTINYLKRTKTIFLQFKKTSKVKNLSNSALTIIFFNILKTKQLRIKILKVKIHQLHQNILAKSGTFFEPSITLNSASIPRKHFNLTIKQNKRILIQDIYSKNLLEKINAINDAVNLKAIPLFITTINKNILLQTDWKLTLNNIIKTK